MIISEHQISARAIIRLWRQNKNEWFTYKIHSKTDLFTNKTQLLQYFIKGYHMLYFKHLDVGSYTLYLLYVTTVGKAITHARRAWNESLCVRSVSMFSHGCLDTPFELLTSVNTAKQSRGFGCSPPTFHAFCVVPVCSFLNPHSINLTNTFKLIIWLSVTNVSGGRCPNLRNSAQLSVCCRIWKFNGGSMREKWVSLLEFCLGH